MSALPEATRGADEFRGPDDAGTYAGTASSVATASAALVNLTIPRGGAYFTFQARGGDVYLRFVAAGSAAGTTIGNGSNGIKIADGQTINRWVYPTKASIDCRSSADCTLFWHQSSPNYDNR